MKRAKLNISMIMYGVALASIVPVLTIILKALHIPDKLYFPIIGGSWLLGIALVFKIIGLWERGNHIIYHDEEANLLDLLQETHGDLTLFYDYTREMIQSEFGAEAQSDIYVTIFENDARYGFAKVHFIEDRDGVSSFTIGKYADITIPKNEVISKYFGLDHRTLFKKDIKNVIAYANVALPGSLVFPLLNDEVGLIGIWCLTIPADVKPDQSPSVVLASARCVLENILTAIYYKNRSNREAPATSTSQALLYHQIINLVNIVLHEIQTPTAVIKNNLFLIKKTGKLTKETFQLLEEMADRIGSRISKMSTYANTILERKDIDHEINGMKVIDVAKWLRDEYANRLEPIAREKKNRTSLRIDPKDIQNKMMVCNSVILQALFEVMENAVRYAAPGTNVSIDITYRPRPTKSTINFVITNTGYIPDEVIEKYKHTSTSADFLYHSSEERGIGIGLSLAHAAIARAGGTISLRNTERHTVIVDIDIPVI